VFDDEDLRTLRRRREEESTHRGADEECFIRKSGKY